MKTLRGKPKWRGRESPQESNSNTKQKKETEVSPRLINFVLHMYNQLTSEQRYEIYLGIKRKWSISRISREIEVSASTVLREIRRNSNTNGEYV